MKLFIFLFFLSGCSIFFGSSSGPKSARGSYSIDFSKSHWKAKEDKRSDYVFEHSDGRILLSNSFCDEFQEQPLEQLAKKTFNTVNNFQALKGEYTTLAHREAYRIEGTGLVDGVKVGLRLLNTRRDNCYFDFLSINPENVKDDDSSFENFLTSVHFK